MDTCVQVALLLGQNEYLVLIWRVPIEHHCEPIESTGELTATICASCSCRNRPWLTWRATICRCPTCWLIRLPFQLVTLSWKPRMKGDMCIVGPGVANDLGINVATHRWCTQTVSASDLIQQGGRAGRVAPGELCVMASEDQVKSQFRGMHSPELLCADIAPLEAGEITFLASPRQISFGPKLLHYITLFFRIDFPDHAIIFYIAQLVWIAFRVM